MKFDRYIFNIPNALSLSRIFALPFVLNLIRDDSQKLPLFLLLLYIFLSDFFDGYLARKLKIVSDFGRTIDPFADMIVMIGIVIMINTYKNFPQWAMYLIITRQILVGLGSIVIYQKRKVVAMSNLLGKLMIFFWALAITSYIFIDATKSHIPFTILIIAVFFLIASLISYIGRIR